jgi:hypothetical protein
MCSDTRCAGSAFEKYDDYAALIEEALGALEYDPMAGRRRPEIAPDAWTYHVPTTWFIGRA